MIKRILKVFSTESQRVTEEQNRNEQRLTEWKRKFYHIYGRLPKCGNEMFDFVTPRQMIGR